MIMQCLECPLKSVETIPVMSPFELKTSTIRGKKLDLKKDLCGREKSRAIEVEYSDAKYEKRVFVTGTSVCMNNNNTRVKGIRIRGKSFQMMAS